jgi:hypothetical protein
MKTAAIWLAAVAFVAWLAIDAGVKIHREARLQPITTAGRQPV